MFWTSQYAVWLGDDPWYEFGSHRMELTVRNIIHFTNDLDHLVPDHIQSAAEFREWLSGHLGSTWSPFYFQTIYYRIGEDGIPVIVSPAYPG
jgi:hypothetical protein